MFVVVAVIVFFGLCVLCGLCVVCFFFVFDGLCSVACVCS